VNPESILIVDDQPAILSTLSGILMDEGYDVQIAESGAEAIASAQSTPPSLVLLDIWMPGMDGLETLTRLRVLLPETRVIMMSGHGSIETAAKTIKLGAYDYIEKPLSLEKVVMLVKHAVDELRLQRENQALKAQVARQSAGTGEGPAPGPPSDT